MEALYAQGVSSSDIAKQLGRDGRLVRTHLKGKLRGRAEAVRLAVDNGKIRSCSVNENFFDVLTPAVAWVLGLLYGDGHVSNRPDIGQYQVTLAGSVQVCAAVQALLGIDKVARRAKKKGKDLNVWILQWSSRRLVQKLGEYGLTGGNKARTMTFPQLPEELLPHFVRGLWDADGSWRRIGSYLGSTYVTASTAFATQLLATLQGALGTFTFNLKENKHRLKDKIFKAWTLTLNVEGTRKLRSWIYDNSTLASRCDRKFTLANVLK